MSYFQFMTACVLGKAAVKACVLQLAGFIIAFSPYHLGQVGSTFANVPLLDVAAAKLQSVWQGIQEKTSKTIKAMETGEMEAEEDSGSFGPKQIFGLLMGGFVLVMILTFVASIIVQFAQQYQAKLDKEEIEALEKKSGKKKRN